MTTEKQHLKAATTNSIQAILLDHFLFKLYIKFNNGKTMTLYGHEHDCTYSQCINGHVDKIVLNRLKGYTALLNYVEHTKKGQYQKAIIYTRQPGEEKFNTICRRYFKGNIEECIDPVLTGAEEIALDFQIINKRVIIRPPGDTTDQLPDFKTIVTDSLNKK